MSKISTEVGSAYLLVTPKLSNDAGSKLAAGGATSGASYGGKFSNAAKGAISAGAVAMGNILASAATTAAANLGQVFTDMFQGAMDFEQLAGGVEKIFDQADIAGIMSDANAAYKDLNMSANEYLAAINQTGAAFAQTMGDQKGYDTARTGMKAIADYASGTGRNIDELNEKFSLITRSTSSYQSIADQFSGILPATSKDFLEQAQAAGFLSDSYKSLTDVPIAEYQEAVSKMLEKGVADMGLAGNTAHESTETITGSLAMLGAAWTNFTTELGKDSADIPTRAAELVDSIVAVVQNIAPRLLAFAQNLFAALPELYEQLSPYIQQFVDMAAQFIEEHQDEIQAASTMLFDGIKVALKEAIKMAIQALGEFIKEVIVTFPEWFPELLKAAGELFLAILEGLVNGIDPFMRQLEDMINGALGAIGDAVGSFVQGGADIIGGIIQGVGEGLDGIRKVFDDVVYAMTHPIETAQGIIEGIIEAIENAFAWMHIDIPSFQLPHIEWHWLDIGDILSIPVFDGISWYAKGGFADSATLAGYGEKGLELYWPSYSPYFDMYAKGIAEHMPASSGVDIHDCTFIVRQESDIRSVAVELNTLVNRQLAGGRA